MKAIWLMVTVCMALGLSGCGTTDSQLQSQGRSEAYVTGFHDGRHSGMREAGNAFEHMIKDQPRFDSESDYQEGWLAGEAEGQRLQRQATAAGDAIGGAYQAHEIDREIDRQGDMDAVAREAVEGMDTSDLKALEND